ncbi:hypothetical protein Pf1_00533 [Flavobacterium columnare]|nr:hypothetical protein Pf1_00533 [Flavobacterium columnare]
MFKSKKNSKFGLANSAKKLLNKKTKMILLSAIYSDVIKILKLKSV